MKKTAGKRKRESDSAGASDPVETTIETTTSNRQERNKKEPSTSTERRADKPNKKTTARTTLPSDSPVYQKILAVLTKACPHHMSLSSHQEREEWARRLLTALVAKHGPHMKSTQALRDHVRSLIFNLKKNGDNLVLRYSPESLVELSAEQLAVGTSVERQRETAR